MPTKMIWGFFKGTLVLVSKGSKAYYIWMVALLCFMGIGSSRTSTSCSTA